MIISASHPFIANCDRQSLKQLLMIDAPHQKTIQLISMYHIIHSSNRDVNQKFKIFGNLQKKT